MNSGKTFTKLLPFTLQIVGPDSFSLLSGGSHEMAVMMSMTVNFINAQRPLSSSTSFQLFHGSHL